MASTSSRTVDHYLNSLEPARGSILKAVHARIIATVSELTARICYGGIGYGMADKPDGPDWVKIGLANQKHHVGLYVCSPAAIELLDKIRERLGKVSLGKSCIRFKRLEDLNLDVAMELVIVATKE